MVVVRQGLGLDPDFYPSPSVVQEVADDAGNVVSMQAANRAAKDLGVIILGFDSLSPSESCMGIH